MSDLINKIRSYHYISCVLSGQQEDNLCSICKAFENTAKKIKKDIAELKNNNAAEINAMPQDLKQFLIDAHNRLSSLKVPENATGQKKAGNCKMPEGVCFVKYSKAISEKL